MITWEVVVTHSPEFDIRLVVFKGEVVLNIIMQLMHLVRREILRDLRGEVRIGDEHVTYIKDVVRLIEVNL